MDSQMINDMLWVKNLKSSQDVADRLEEDGLSAVAAKRRITELDHIMEMTMKSSLRQKKLYMLMMIFSVPLMIIVVGFFSFIIAGYAVYSLGKGQKIMESKRSFLNEGLELYMKKLLANPAPQ
jgi:nucleoside diphosphate kinase